MTCRPCKAGVAWCARLMTVTVATAVASRVTATQLITNTVPSLADGVDGASVDDRLTALCGSPLG